MARGFAKPKFPYIVHHLDRHMDSTTALRFHFGEIAISVALRPDPAQDTLTLGVGGFLEGPQDTVAKALTVPFRVPAQPPLHRGAPLRQPFDALAQLMTRRVCRYQRANKREKRHPNTIRAKRYFAGSDLPPLTVSSFGRITVLMILFGAEPPALYEPAVKTATKSYSGKTNIFCPPLPCAALM